MPHRRSPPLLSRVAAGALALLAAACGSHASAPCAPGEARSAVAGAAVPPTQTAARPAIRGPGASPITFEQMARYPEPGWAVPRAIAYSPDGKQVTFLQSEPKSDQMALYAFDVAAKKVSLLFRGSDVLAGDRPLSREEELRRERQRQRIQGVTTYRWAKKSPRMVIPLGGDVFLRDGAAPVARLTDTADAEIDPQICAGGERVAFVRGSELFSVDVATRKETQLTRGAPEGVSRGLSDFNGQEEFDEESGFWWSPGCDRVAYLEVDERGVATEPVLGFRGGKPDLMMQRYPRAGAANPKVRVGVLDLATRTTRWVKWPNEEARYFGRFEWSADGKALWLQTLSRDQRRLTLSRVDPLTGVAADVITETAKEWVDFTLMAPLERSPRLLWTTVVDGHRHLELRDASTGARTTTLTRGAWDVEAIESVDEDAGQVMITATKDGPLQRHLYAVPLAGGEPRRLTEERGVHRAHVAEGGAGWVDVHSAIDRAPRAQVRGKDGALLGELPVHDDPGAAALRLRPIELLTVPRPNGPALHAAMLRPRAMEPGRRYPVVVMVYGGPHVQTVLDQWSPRLMWQHLADRGFVVFQLDNRGSAGRGPGFEVPIHGKLGEVELADQIAGLDWLATQPFVDATRVGIYGHSYGGFLAALAMLKAPDRFRVGISASPVTEWSLYDTGYTERYMDTPAKNPAGYAAADLGKLAPNLKGDLFIIHALMDENVHFQNSAHLIDALVAANKRFDLLVFPGERHGYRSPTAKVYALRRVVDYLVEKL
jgi:dipeptidyl-peptidase 4